MLKGFSLIILIISVNVFAANSICDLMNQSNGKPVVFYTNNLKGINHYDVVFNKTGTNTVNGMYYHTHMFAKDEQIHFTADCENNSFTFNVDPEGIKDLGQRTAKLENGKLVLDYFFKDDTVVTKTLLRCNWAIC